MFSTDTRLTIMRGGVVLHAAGAAVCLVVTMMLPIFRYDVPELKSSITQSMWTTDLYGPPGEKHVPATDFVSQCRDLTIAFRALQVSSIVGIVALALAFLCAVFHMAPSFTGTRHRIRTVCGAPICTLLLIAIAAAGVNCYITHAMYERDWCKNQQTHAVAGVALAVPAVAALPVAPVEAVAAIHPPPPAKRLYVQAVAVRQGHLTRPLAAGIDSDICDPFKGCIASYRTMGFKGAVGWQTMWAALTVAVTGLFAELMVMAIGGSHVTEAGVGAAAASLLRGDDEERLL